ncbi:putative sulfoacetate transporter SauU [Novipirellula galeiformis]|uniref:Putative sulfoacetate transporter SauU n=1 Tax=Novipirellula galeiformis TaxID=2528004 RepID=A0A5C6BYY1_9BACT|nr:MFS transporter [Novipirellula galeiformis]TWU17155.1 putative sulfoacetate transporter SauU [Novipirellula galeiformis]
MRPSSTRIRYRALAWLTLAAALAYLSRNAVGVAESTIREDIGFSLEQSGWFMGAFFWTYSLFQVPSGWLAERWGTRITLSVFAFAWSVATFGIGVAPGFWLLIVAQLVMGVAQAGIFPASCNSVGHWLPLGQRSLSCGILAAGMQIGAILASGLTGLLLAPFGWRWVFIGFAMPGILWTLGFYLRFRNHPEQDSRVNAAELEKIRSGRAAATAPAADDAASVSEWGELLAIVRSPVMWWLCGQQICRGSGYMFFASWFPTFLQETRGVSVAESGYLQGLVLAGTLAGSIFGGTLVDWIWRRTGSLRLSRSGVGATFLAACALLILAAWFVQNAVLAVALLSLGSFLAALAGPCAFAATIDIGGPRVPQVFGVMNMTGNLAAAACPVLVGYLFQWTSNWNLVLLLFAAVYLVGAVCWIFVNPQKHIDNA